MGHSHDATRAANVRPRLQLVELVEVREVREVREVYI
jgi:hypothetical protein